MLSGPWKQGLGPLLGRDYNLGTCASKGEYTAASALLQTLLVDREDHVATHARCKVMSYATRTFAPDPSLRWVPLLQALGPTSTACILQRGSKRHGARTTLAHKRRHRRQRWGGGANAD